MKPYQMRPLIEACDAVLGDDEGMIRIDEVYKKINDGWIDIRSAGIEVAESYQLSIAFSLGENLRDWMIFQISREQPKDSDGKSLEDIFSNRSFHWLLGTDLYLNPFETLKQKFKEKISNGKYSSLGLTYGRTSWWAYMELNRLSTAFDCGVIGAYEWLKIQETKHDHVAEDIFSDTGDTAARLA